MSFNCAVAGDDLFGEGSEGHPLSCRQLKRCIPNDGEALVPGKGEMGARSMDGGSWKNPNVALPIPLRP